MNKIRRIAMVFCMAALLAGCGETAVIDGKRYSTCGLLDHDTDCNPNIQYKIIVSNLFLAAVFSETFIIPVYIIGFELWEPIGKKDKNFEPGVIGNS